MRREPRALHGRFDLLVVGGGVYGACLARIASRAGLSVALVEKGDFGAATSRNSLKIVHGGFRYIQHFDLPRIRESVRAQNAWLRAAPHLVRPMRCVIPAFGHGFRGPEVYAAGLAAYGIAAFGRGRGLTGRSRLPRAGLLSSRALVARRPELARADLTGGAHWSDAQMLDPARLTLECLEDAVAHGAVIANHVAAVAPLFAGNRVAGARVRDALDGAEYEIQATTTINAAGAHAAEWITVGGKLRIATAHIWTRNLNVVVGRLFDTEDAVGVESRRPADSTVGKAKRLFFVTPWRDCSIVGTSHLPHEGPPDTLHDFVRADLDTFLSEVRGALPGARLSDDDVRSVHIGLTPAESAEGRARRGLVIDHGRTDGVPGMLSVLGIKYTTAPTVAAALIDRVLAGRSLPASAGFAEPLPGSPEVLPERAPWEVGGEADWAQWIYGRRWPALSGAVPREGLAEEEWIFRSRVRHGIDNEMVVRLADAVLRASDVAERGLLSQSRIAWCRHELAARFGWDEARIRAETEDLRAKLRDAVVRVRA